MKGNGDFDGRRAVVTGSGGAMGAAIAVELAARGAKVVLNDRLADRTAAAVDEVREAGGEAFGVTASVTRTNGANTLIAAAIELLGGLTSSSTMWVASRARWRIRSGRCPTLSGTAPSL